MAYNLGMDVSKKIDQFFKTNSLRKAKKSEIIIHAGEPPPGVIYLEKGRVAQIDYSNAGNKLIITIFKPGAFFPMSWALNRGDNRYFYKAVDDIEYRLADPDSAVDLLKKNPDIMQDLLSRLYIGIDGVVKRMTFLMGANAKTRLLYELSIEARRFGDKRQSGHVLKITETELAARTGLARETVSREIGKLKDQGLLKTEGYKLIISDSLLKQAADL